MEQQLFEFCIPLVGLGVFNVHCFHCYFHRVGLALHKPAQHQLFHLPFWQFEHETVDVGQEGLFPVRSYIEQLSVVVPVALDFLIDARELVEVEHQVQLRVRLVLHDQSRELMLIPQGNPVVSRLFPHSTGHIYDILESPCIRKFLSSVIFGEIVLQYFNLVFVCQYKIISF